ncbi:hypothetical protein [Aquimarina macrocephali]|uniref:hypothetical protein n=1 Tax=Aquimarina macrocephali TaxID=666563 RepID=UPI003F676EF9
MNVTNHNGFRFEIVRYYDDKAVIEIKEGGVQHHSFITEKVENLTTNFGGGFEEWVKDNY